jgi:very-short-patch-repair endonuclease
VSELEATLALHIRAAGLPEPEREARLIPGRRFRFDFAWPGARPPLAVEVQGGGWQHGKHHRPAGYRADCVKANLLTLAGWRVLRFDSTMVEDGTAVRQIEEALTNGT